MPDSHASSDVTHNTNAERVGHCNDCSDLVYVSKWLSMCTQKGLSCPEQHHMVTSVLISAVSVTGCIL